MGAERTLGAFSNRLRQGPLGLTNPRQQMAMNLMKQLPPTSAASSNITKDVFSSTQNGSVGDSPTRYRVKSLSMHRRNVS